jgi:hypothetical protein
MLARYSSGGDSDAAMSPAALVISSPGSSFTTPRWKVATLGLETVGDWHQDHLVSPVDDLLGLIPEGSEVTDLDRYQRLAKGIDGVFRTEAAAQRLAEGIDGVFRTEVAAQYPGWPPGSTTDGASVDICFRCGRQSLEVIGLMYIDFGGEVLPFRALIERTESLISLDGFIGQVDDRTGHPLGSRQGP